MILSRYKRFVLWGLTEGHDSFRHIHRHYAHALERLGKEYAWLEDSVKSRAALERDDLVFAVDIASKHLGHPVEGVFYVLHNFGPAAPIWDGLPEENALRLQVYTNACERWGVEWAPARRYDREGRILFQPWGSDLSADELKEPVFNPRSTEIPFVGSIWDGNGQGNIHAISELQQITDAHRLVFRHYQHISDVENVSVVRAARLAPAITGAWQVEQDYLPCRCFKNVAYGTLALTNVPKFRELFKDCFTSWGSISQIVTDALSLPEHRYLELVRAQQEVVARYTYKESLEAIERALEEGR
jgi:hypothetical protein